MSAKPDPRPPGDAALLAFLASVAASGTVARGGETSYESWKRELKAVVARDPFDATIVTVVGGAFLFYLAEKDHNPKVRSYFDALVFLSTCMSVGYADVFARTPAGKAIASAVMTFGPAMSGAMFDPGGPDTVAAPRDATPEMVAVQRVIVDKLEAILTELRSARGAAATTER